MAFALTGCRIFTGENFLEDHAVVIEGERIRAVLPRTDLPDMDVRDLGGGFSPPASSTCR
jgi:N-acetylglucosamine-6-phosphate deacetylase